MYQTFLELSSFDNQILFPVNLKPLLKALHLKYASGIIS